MRTQIKTPIEIERIRISGHMLAEVLRVLARATVPGITTGELEQISVRELKALGGKPAFLGFEGFPATTCISVNNEIVHGIPGKRVVAEGDIVGLDFGVNYEGMITDGAVTVGVGEIEPRVQRLLSETQRSLELGIAQVKDGARIGDISEAIEKHLRKYGFGVVEDMSGHGVGHHVHEDPLILNYGRAGTGSRLQAGMTIAIEPMATLGSKDVLLEDDNWTIITADGSWAAQFEHTVLVTEDGAEILTQ